MPRHPSRASAERAAPVALKQVDTCLPDSAFSAASREEPICRLCWDTENSESGELVSPCACSGSLRYIHRRCLADWQRTQRQAGQGRKAQLCELCKAPYQLPEQQQQSGRRLSVPRRIITTLQNAVWDALYANSWPAVAMRVWKSYVMAQGIAQALKLGMSGFSAGLVVGKSLIEEQASLLNGMLQYTSGFLGSPYAEMIWCQAVGALFVGMLSELVYTSILGMLGGLAYGKLQVRAHAIHSSAVLQQAQLSPG
eukprot:GHUV01021462.1.p1 GENE.GHUV01021462.1~~GHUV01021462.1.p1  ORF type:complete len:254 (+),score=38.97 GHUV01021462.1:133-894(+)